MVDFKLPTDVFLKKFAAISDRAILLLLHKNGSLKKVDTTFTQGIIVL